jgi:hypothetical protein
MSSFRYAAKNRPSSRDRKVYVHGPDRAEARAALRQVARDPRVADTVDLPAQGSGRRTLLHYWS